MNLNITINTKQVDRQLVKILQDQPKYLVRAINSTADQSLNQWIKLVQGKYTITRSIKKYFNIYRATTNKQVARIAFNPRREYKVSLVQYQVRQTRTGVKTEVIRGKSETLRHAFIATMPSGHKGVFQRTGQKKIATRGRYKGRMRETIKELYGPSLPKVFGNSILVEKLQKFIGEKIVQQLNREYQAMLRGY